MAGAIGAFFGGLFLLAVIVAGTLFLGYCTLVGIATMIRRLFSRN